MAGTNNQMSEVDSQRSYRIVDGEAEQPEDGPIGGAGADFSSGLGASDGLRHRRFVSSIEGDAEVEAEDDEEEIRNL